MVPALGIQAEGHRGVGDGAVLTSRPGPGTTGAGQGASWGRGGLRVPPPPPADSRLLHLFDISRPCCSKSVKNRDAFGADVSACPQAKGLPGTTGAGRRSKSEVLEYPPPPNGPKCAWGRLVWGAVRQEGGFEAGTMMGDPRGEGSSRPHGLSRPAERLRDGKDCWLARPSLPPKKMSP